MAPVVAEGVEIVKGPRAIHDRFALVKAFNEVRQDLWGWGMGGLGGDEGWGHGWMAVFGLAVVSARGSTVYDGWDTVSDTGRTPTGEPRR